MSSKKRMATVAITIAALTAGSVGVASAHDGTKKMSKSDESEASRINLTDTEEEIVQKIKKAKTDNELIPDTESKLADRPEARNLINIVSILIGTTIEKTLKELSGKNFSELKNRLSEALTKEVARIMSLKDGTKKMSKSDESEASRINLTDTEEDIVQKIKKAKTDNDLIPDTESKLADRPEARNLINIFSILSGTTIEKTLKELSGKNFSELKNKLSESLIKEIVPI